MGLLGFGEIACCTPGLPQAWPRGIAGDPRCATPTGTSQDIHCSVYGTATHPWDPSHPRFRRGVRGFGAGPPQLTYGTHFTKPKVTLRGIADGEKGTLQTLEAMKAAVLGEEGAHNSDVRLLAQEIVSHVGNKDYVAEAQAIYDFMVKEVRYTLDPRGLEWVQTPWWTLLVRAQGDPRGPLSFGAGGHVGSSLRRSRGFNLRTRRRPRARLRLPHRQGRRGSARRVESRVRRDRASSKRERALAPRRLNGEVGHPRAESRGRGEAPHEDLGSRAGVSRRGER